MLRFIVFAAILALAIAEPRAIPKRPMRYDKGYHKDPRAQNVPHHASPCAIPCWFGDGYCDDENNTEECGYDGGDCCNNDKPDWDYWCDDCQCLEEGSGTGTGPATIPPADVCDQDMIGDQFCDDEYNTELCGYDGGDCCNNSMWWWDYFCTACLCLEEGGTTAEPATEGPTIAPADCTCGVQSAAGRIVGGNEATANEYPWQIGLTSAWGNSPYCGGTIISDQYIMTAAHCTISSSASSVRVLVAEHALNQNNDGAYKVEVEQIINHPQYNGNTVDYDFAILKLKTPLTFTDKVLPACLPPPGDDSDYVGVDAVVSGWGTLSSGGSSPNALHEVTVPVLANNNCGNYAAGDITDRMMCAGLLAGGKDACQGDSGGPLVTQINGAYRLIGVVSWGNGCAWSNYPGIYSRVTSVLPWIYENIGSSNTCSGLVGR